MTPLLFSTLVYALGLLPGLRFPAGPAAVVACAIVASLAFAFGRDARGAALFAAVGVLAGSARSTQLSHDCRSAFADSARVALVGVPLSLPVEGRPVSVHAAHLVAAGGGRCGDVTVRVHVPRGAFEAVHAAALGDARGLTMTGRWIVQPRRDGWPRGAEFAGAVLADSVGAGTLQRASLLTRFRARRQAALRDVVPKRWPLAEALLLAQRSGLTTETRATWVAAGLVHLLAISGMHVGLIAAGVLGLARLLGLPRRRAHRLALLVTAAYVLFLGAPHAALRALLQATLLLGSLELQRPAEPFTLVAAAAFVILLIDPLAVIDPGFQLSFAGIAGLFAWRRPVFELLPARMPRFIRDGLAAGIAASALTTPIAALHFGQAAWIGVPASILATPALACAIAALVAALVLHPLIGAVPHTVTLIVDAPLFVLERIAAAAAAVPGGHMFVSPDTVLIVLFAIMIAIVVRRRWSERSELAPPSHAPEAAHVRYANRGRRAAIVIAIAGATGCVVVSWTPALLRAHGEQLEIHAIDVGQGDALAVRSPHGHWFLIDAGPRTLSADAGRDRVTPYLQRRGVHRLEALILTHPDADHIGGAAAVLDAFDVGVVVDPGLAAGKDMYIGLLSAASSEHVRWIAAREGIAFAIDGVRFEFLYPPRDVDALRDANDNSVVFRLVFGSFAALFLGDAPAAVEEELVSRHGAELRATVLKVGHHGSRTSTSEALLDAARPTIALVSVGRRNRYGHPAASVMRRLELHEVRVLRTDELGNVMVRAQRNGRVDAHAR